MNLQQHKEEKVVLDTVAQHSTQYLNPEIFRAYDIRGIVGDTLGEHSIAQIADGLARLMLEAGQTQIIVGRDERLSSPDMTQALIRGDCDTYYVFCLSSS